MSHDKHCLGCGHLLQNDDIKAHGYAKSLDFDYCMSCFKLKHYGVDLGIRNDDYNFDIKPNSLVLVVYSVLNLDYLFIDNLVNLGDNLTFYLVINQLDLLSEDNRAKFINNLTTLARSKLRKYEDIIFLSAKSYDDGNNLKKLLLNRKFKDIYLYGAQNSGKTSILNLLTNDESLVGLKFGLTASTITKRMNDINIHDLPGLKRRGSIMDVMSYEEYKKLIPKVTINPKVYQITANNYLNINDLIYVKSNKAGTILLYIDNYLPVTRKNQKSFEALLTNKDNELTRFKMDDNIQVHLSDLGFIQVRGISNLEIIKPRGLRLNVTKRLF